ncbi:MAG: DoxX family protein [Bacteroidales bacterium]|nr:DoxX family protein [Bacteroidales bacterium]
MELTSNGLKKLTITIIRIAIGWHFLYEGITKLFIEGWSSQSYLINTSGFLSGFYHWLAGGEALVKVVDFMNIYCLILIGLALFIGVFIRLASVLGILLLILYYFAYPPFGTSLFGSGEGHFYIVNRNFVESFILLFFVISKQAGYGIDVLIQSLSNRRKQKEDTVTGENKPEPSLRNSRREVLKNLATLPFLGAMGWGAFRHIRKDVDVMSGATIQLDFSSLNELKGELPTGKIGDHEISRLVAGGNLVGGWAHARDLIYASSLFKAYNTEKKVYETLMLAEQAGINTINIGFSTNALIAKYKKATGSKIKVISQIHPEMDKEDYFVNIDKAIDFGVDIVQIQGNHVDWLVRDNRIDVVEKMLDHIRKQGYVAGLASHTVDALIACEEQGIIPDYYMKTMHHDNYWSAHPIENRVPFEVDGKNHLEHDKFHNNCFCLFPDKTVEFVNRATVPVMGFKILAAGAIEPADGFNWAFRNGADFICVGMFDFQIVDDVNTTIDVLNNLSGRQREWYG